MNILFLKMTNTGKTKQQNMPYLQQLLIVMQYI